MTFSERTPMRPRMVVHARGVLPAGGRTRASGRILHPERTGPAGRPRGGWIRRPASAEARHRAPAERATVGAGSVRDALLRGGCGMGFRSEESGRRPSYFRRTAVHEGPRDRGGGGWRSKGIGPPRVSGHPCRSVNVPMRDASREAPRGAGRGVGGCGSGCIPERDGSRRHKQLTSVLCRVIVHHFTTQTSAHFGPGARHTAPRRGRSPGSSIRAVPEIRSRLDFVPPGEPSSRSGEGCDDRGGGRSRSLGR